MVHDRPWVNRGARQGRGAAALALASALAPAGAPTLVLALTLVLTLALAGCGGTGPVASSVDFVHGLEGGAIAAQRPPPPGAGQPFPNLGTIPARPVPLPPSARQQVADALSIDRTLAEREAALAPLPLPAPAAAAAAAAAPASPPPAAPPPDPNASTATMPASTPPAAPAGATPAAPPVAAIPASVASAGPPPTIPAAPPSPASIPGFAVPTEPPPLVLRLGAAPAATPVPQAAPGLVPIAFAAGSSVLPRDAYLALRALSVARHGRTIDVTGRGEAPSSLPALQAAALQLGLERAQAIAAALNVAGVPPSAIRLHAAAAGRGGWARLVG